MWDPPRFRNIPTPDAARKPLSTTAPTPEKERLLRPPRVRTGEPRGSLQGRVAEGQKRKALVGGTSPPPFTEDDGRKAAFCTRLYKLLRDCSERSPDPPLSFGSPDSVPPHSWRSSTPAACIPMPTQRPFRSPCLDTDELCGNLPIVNAQLAPIFQLSRAEKLQFVEELWDSIAQEESREPLQPLARWKIDELSRRKEAFEKDPSKARTWEQVEAGIIGQGAVRCNLTF